MNKRFKSITAFVTPALLALALAGCAGTSKQESTGELIDDSVITTKVKAALVKDPVVSALAVSVETRKGIVVLSGFVDNESQARRAAEVAAGVQGVVSVKSGLVVKS